MECDYCCAENQAAAINDVLTSVYGLPKDQCTSNSMTTCVFDKSTGPDRDNKLITPEQKNCCTQEEFDVQKSKVMNRMEEVLKTVPSDPGGFDQKINKLNQQKQVYTIPLDPVGYTGKGTSEDPWKATKLTDGYPRFMNDEERKKYYCRENNCEIPGDYFYKIVMNKVDAYM
jgi:hypothetical protein